MIKARAVIDSDGMLLEFEASGHARRGNQGFDIVCAAFTVLARTAYGSLALLPGARVGGSAPEPGSLDFRVESMPGEEREKAIGMSAYLLEGLRSLEREFPDAVGIRTETVRRK
ncbi:MAG TPA: ribosomal-processing cysteine protease Prp [Rectinemataceae bacterium]|nr:ribosomal-processing cysteine protease Prp [Rectinemataceae bacterium]